MDDDAVYYVVEGEVNLRRKFDNGSGYEYSVGKDGLFGVVSTMTGRARFLTAVTSTNSQLYVWPKEAFISALSLYIEFARLSIQELSRELRVVNQESEKVWGPP